MQPAAPDSATPEAARQSAAVRRTAMISAGVAAGMLALAFASAPLYDLFCRVTGFGGTPMVASVNASAGLGRSIDVRFDAGVASGLNWRFAAEAPKMTVRLGETVTVLYKVRNAGDQPSVGISTFNVIPEIAGQYFNKLQCFCFNETPLKPGEEIETAVTFFVDPALARDKDIGSLSSITLSYTFFAAKTGVKAAKPLAAVGTDRQNGRL